MLSEYRSGDGRSISTIDTIDLLGILAVFLGGAIATTGLASIFGVVFADYTLTLSGTSFGAGLVMIASGFASIIVTNGLSREEFLNANSLEGVLFLLAIGMVVLLFLEPTIVVENIINNNWGQLVTTALLTVDAGLLATQ
jgi:hypothetical protein